MVCPPTIEEGPIRNKVKENENCKGVPDMHTKKSQ
jgi:hypothetical protein